MYDRLSKRLSERDESGFTLIELLIVIVILGILAGIVVFSVSGVTNRGTAAACKADLKTVQVASEAYYAKNGSWAANMDGLKPDFLQDTPDTTVSYTTGSPPTIVKAGAC